MSLEELKQQRKNVMTSITRIKEILEGEGKSVAAAEVKCRSKLFETYTKEIFDLQSTIEKLDIDDTGRPEIEELYVATELIIQTHLNGSLHNSTVADSSYLMTSSRYKLPKLQLPTFSGQYSEFKNFLSSFQQMIDSETSLTNIEKFNHLINCLQGQALETVKAFQVTSENYPKALARLKSRYDNRTLIFLDNITSLFELPSVSQPNSNQLRSLVDNASALYDSLLSLGTEKEISQAMLIYLVINKVDAQTKVKWNESLDFKKLPTWPTCAELLERHCQHLGSLHSVPDHNIESSISDKLSKNKNKRRGYTFSCSKSICQLCSSSDHKIIYCSKFRNMEVDQRFETAKKLNLCINCLSKGHQSSKCQSSFKCKTCSRNHHSLLHRKQQATSNAAPGLSTDATEFKPNNAAVHTHLESSLDHIILATAMILVRDAVGDYKLGRALLDSCSQVNFITDEFSQSLRLPRRKQNMEIHGIGNSSTNIKYSSSTTIKSCYTEFQIPLSFCVTSHIAYQPEAEIETSSWKLPSNIELADENFFKSRRIDLLLGTESSFDILAVGQIKLGSNLPTLQKTLLGWIVSGRYKGHSTTPTSTCLLSIEESIDKNLKRLWELDEVPPPVEVRTCEQKSCEQVFTKTVSRNADGRVVVRLPFKDNPNRLGSSYHTALKRFLAQERRLSRSPDLKNQYVAFLTEYEKLGHMSVVTNPNLNAPHFYIPHHCVQRPSSTSTKLRVVFDASCNTTSQQSLNDLLMVGPTIQSELFMTLLRFRLFRYAITADIIKMYRQVLIAPEDRCFQYILWRTSPEEHIRTYVLNTVTYGTAAAPYLAVRSLNYVAEEYSLQFPLGAEVIKSSFYVDDLLCGADSLKELSRMKYEVTEVLKKGCFELDKWHSNHTEFMDDKTIKNLSIDNGSVTSALGITWDQTRDTFLFSFQPKHADNGRVTKRTILSIASSLFDPLGLVAPLIITAKIILQELWLLKLAWDESVPQNLHLAWQSFLQNLSELHSLTVPRYCLAPHFKSLQLHGFCDASIRAYGSCIYARTESEDGNISVQLLTAKSRVAPTKKQSLPKLELCGALLLARLYAKVKGLFNCTNSNVFLWTDSQVVIHWLKQHSATLSTFVGNRVSEVQDLTAGVQWRHVPTHSNPADVVSRGCSLRELQSSIWFAGPTFLAASNNKWPIDRCDSLDIEEINKEKRKSTFLAAIEENHLLNAIEKYSSHTFCLRVVASMLRFTRNIKKNYMTDLEVTPLTSDELQNAFWCIVWNLQQQNFAKDISLLQSNKTTRGALKNLNPFLQSTGGYTLLKVGGRLELADLPESRKHPILLPGKSSFVLRYIRHLHLQNYHAGAKALVALIRLEYWVVNAREVARHVVRSCIHCVRYKPKLLQQTMGNLPESRVNPSRPFSRCGVDFCGPINTYLRIRGKGPTKTYVAIFICFATKAVHIEAVSDLSTNAFIAALKRMIARRGLPADIYCDNATNFIGTRNQLADLKAFLFNVDNQHSIDKYCADYFINFHFIPPRAPHFGGLWEAAVKSAKGHLVRSLMNTRFTFEELTTALVEIEAILNSRPISPLSSDPSDFEALTPAHFLVGSSLKALPERNLTCNNIGPADKWACITTVKQQFWQRWLHEYINELQVRSKWTQVHPNVKVGSMVILHEDNVAPQLWRLGRVAHEIAGKDSRVRVVDVQTSKGIIRRPISKLALLPV